MDTNQNRIYFDEHIDGLTPYARRMRALVREAKELHASIRTMNLRSIEIVGELAKWRYPTASGRSIAAFAKYIGLTGDQFLKRAAAARVLEQIPVARSLLLSGELTMSHLAQIAGKITPANQQLVLEGIKGKSTREIKLFLSRVTPMGDLLPQEETVDIKMTLTKDQVALLERARAVLAAAGKVPTDVDIFVKAMDDLLNRRDPMRRAERAAARQAAKALQPDECRATGDTGGTLPPEVCAEKHGPQDHDTTLDTDGSQGHEDAAARHQQDTGMAKVARPTSRYIPAAARHAIWRRDGGQCTFVYSDGSRCQERMMLEIDHRRLFCRGGEHTAANLRLLCRQHNDFAAAYALGFAWYGARRGGDGNSEIGKAPSEGGRKQLNDFPLISSR